MGTGIIGAALAAIALTAAAPARGAAVDSNVGVATRDALRAVERARAVMMVDPAAADAIGRGLEERVGRTPADRDATLALAKAAWIRGEAAARANRPDAAAALIERARDLARRAGDRQTLADALLSRGSLLQETQHPAEALRDYLTAADLYRKTGRTRSHSIALQYLGMLYQQGADPARAGRYYREAWRVHHSEPRMNVALLNSMGSLALDRNDPFEAEHLYRRGVDVARRSGETGLETTLLVGLAQALSSQGRNAEALRQIERSMAMGARTRRTRDDAMATYAMTLQSSGRSAEALRAVERLRPEIGLAEGTRSDIVHEAAYLVYRANGRAAEALAQFERLQRSRERMTRLSLSTKAALLSSRFDYAGQELRIARLRAGELARRYRDERSSSARQRDIAVTGAAVFLVLTAMLGLGLFAITRSRNRERVAKAALEGALEEARASAAAEREATMLAEHDSLTGLPNRRHLNVRLASEFGRCGSDDRECAVLLMDLDRFKAINDVNGHETGDAVLVEVARRIGRTCRDHGAYAVRMGGDEFAIVAINVPAGTTERMATEILASISEPFEAKGRRHQLGTSIGIARYGCDGHDVESLMRAADVAMYEAKRSGRNTHRFYDAELDRRMRDRAEIEDDLRAALRDDAIEPWFQPIVDLSDGRVCGFEALARWRHPTRGMVPPDVFVPIAEEARLIDDLTTVILQKACRAARDWPEDVTVSVNISPATLRDTWIVVKTFGILKQERIDPTRLTIEITENAVIDDMEFARQAIDSLREAGVRVALDDFGKGYSSLSTLRDLSFDDLKLDASFVKALDSEDACKITTAVAGLAATMGIASTAEGVETPDAAARLKALGFDKGQGWHFGRPMTADMAAAAVHSTRMADTLAA